MAENLLRLLPYAVNAARTLDEPDDGPGQVVVDDDVAVLEVLALAEHVGGDEDAKLLIRVSLPRTPVAFRAESPCQPGGVVGVAGDARHGLHASALELRFEVVNRVGELGEDQHLLVRERLRQEVVERVELRVVGRVPCPIGL